MTSWTISPSDLTFLWDECPRCFYLKVVNKFNRPAAPFPTIFGTIDRAMKQAFQGHNAKEISPSLPSGKLIFTESMLTSAPIQLPGANQQLILRGKLDCLAQFDEGSYGVIDFKTSEPKEAHVPFYGRQLQAYARCLENPAPQSMAFSPISILGLLYFVPRPLANAEPTTFALGGRLEWHEVPRDDTAFDAFLSKVAVVLSAPEPPPASESCKYCQYRNEARETGL
jgi:hypothetical protein